MFYYEIANQAVIPIYKRRMKKLLKKFCMTLIPLAVLTAGIRFIPAWWCSRGADAWFDGALATQQKLAAGVEQSVLREGVHISDFTTTNELFNGEWLFGSYMMAGMGFGQMALEHPELKSKNAALMAECIEHVLSKEVRAFDNKQWSEDPIESLGSMHGHAAFLGYFNLLLGLHRLVDPSSKFAELNDRITDALIRRINASAIALLQSYPGEVYPIDNSLLIASIALHARVSGQSHDDVVKRYEAIYREKIIDPKSGIPNYAVDMKTAKPFDKPRGSGATLSLFAFVYADPQLSREMYNAVKKNLQGTRLGFGAVREYPEWTYGGYGDVDSGPVIMGFGVSPTGFCLAGARIWNDRNYFSRLYATAHLFGAPVTRSGKLEFVSGGPLGNAILFAMLTAPRPETLEAAYRNVPEKHRGAP
jgi:hypothetical protein